MTDYSFREAEEKLDAPFWIKAWNWLWENPLDWLLGSKWGNRCFWIIFWLFVMLVFWWVAGVKES